MPAAIPGGQGPGQPLTTTCDDWCVRHNDHYEPCGACYNVQNSPVCGFPQYWLAFHAQSWLVGTTLPFPSTFPRAASRRSPPMSRPQYIGPNPKVAPTCSDRPPPLHRVRYYTSHSSGQPPPSLPRPALDGTIWSGWHESCSYLWAEARLESSTLGSGLFSAAYLPCEACVLAVD